MQPAALVNIDAYVFARIVLVQLSGQGSFRAGIIRTGDLHAGARRGSNLRRVRQGYTPRRRHHEDAGCTFDEHVGFRRIVSNKETP